MTQEESLKIPGSPYVYIRVNVTYGAQAANIDVELVQDARLERNGQLATGVTTWSTSILISHPTAQGIRDQLKDASMSS